VPNTGNPLDQLDKLAQLHNSGALTDAEFEAEKRRILGG
jgi:Short C-terminal domain